MLPLNMSEENKTLEVLWSVKQVATYLGFNTGTIYQWISEKRMLDPTKIIHLGSRVRIPRSEVERLAGIVKGKLEASA